LMKRLIVNADDFGMSLDISRGVIEAVSSGLVRATSAMASSPAFGVSMEELSSSGIDMDVGLHVTLTWGRPISDPGSVTTLVDDGGNFLSGDRLFLRALLGGVSVDEAYREMRAQAEFFLSKRPFITHLDGHHHVHVFPTISLAAARIAQKFKIPVVRSPVEGRWSRITNAAIRRLAVALIPAASPDFWRRQGLSTPDNFGGFALGAGKKLKRRWIEALGRLPDGTTEIMVHPGYGGAEGDGYAGRRDEIGVLSDGKLLEIAASNGVEIVDFRVL